MSSIGINTGLKALLSARYMLDTIGHNIANANTPGYSRQRVQLGSSLPVQYGRLLLGTGVDAGQVQRSVDDLLGRRIQAQQSLLGSLSAQRSGLSSFESLFAEPSENGLGKLLDGFFSAASQLSTAPSDSILRANVVNSTQGLAARFRDLSAALASSSSDAMADITSRVGEVNELAGEIVELNLRIGETESGGTPANDLRDRRDVALSRLSELVDTSIVDGPNGSVRVLVAGNTLVGSARANRMTVTSDDAGKTAIQIAGSSGQVPVRSGEIGGLLRLGGELAPAYRERLDRLAHGLILEANRVHTTGVPGGGSFETLTGTVRLQDFDQDGRLSDELLSNAGLPFDVVSGSLYVNVVDQASGELSKHRIDISQTHTTVQDFVDALNEVPHLSAAVDSSGRLRLGADTGFAFDFSRRLDATPDANGTFGGTNATLGTSASGPFALADGDTLNLTVNSGGAPVAISLTLSAADFEEISAATAEELAAVVNADPAMRAGGMSASAVEGRLFLQTQAEGSEASFTLNGGTAVAGLGWTGVLDAAVVGQANGVDVRVSGTYEGATDQGFVFRPLSDGTVGTTDGLQVEVLDRAGNLVTTLDVGAGYVPGTPLELTDGVQVTFGLGELSATHGDLFSFDAVVDSDTTDVLVALGLNTLFTGSNAGDIEVRAELETDPGGLAFSLSGEEGDGVLLLDLLDVDRQAAQGLEGSSIGRFWGDLVGDVGFEAALTDGALSSGGAVLDSLAQRQASISGVNVDEELVDLVAYEQAFAAAAQYLSVVNQLGEEILNLL